MRLPNCLRSIPASASRRSPTLVAACTALLSLGLPPPAGAQGEPTPICLAPSSATLIGMQSADAGLVIDTMLAEYLHGPRLEIIQLESRLATQARHEATDLGCGFVLFTTVEQKRRDSGFTDRLAAGAIYSGAGSAAGVVESAGARVLAGAVSGAASTVVMSNEVRSRDQMTLTYRLEAPGGRAVLNKSHKRRAGADSEDMITPLVEVAAEAVAGRILGE
jgi:hypothetical protein